MKKILTTLLFLLVTIVTQAGMTFTQGNYTYETITDSTCYLTGLSSAGSSLTTLTIPGFTFCASTQKYYQVKFIYTQAFSGNTKITEVRIEPGVETLYGYVFYNCTNLKTVSLPSTLTSIGNYCFYNCPLQYVNCAAETMPTFQTYALSNLGSVSGTRYWREGTRTGWSNANANSTITNLFTVNWSSTTAYDVAGYIGSTSPYYRCYTYAIVTKLWSPVSQRGGECKIIYASPHSNNTTGTLEVPYNEDISAQYARYAPVEIADYAFQNTTAIKKVLISAVSDFKKIGICAFQNCTSLTGVTLCAKTIGNLAFENCTNLTSVQLYGNNENSYCVETLGSECFKNTGVTSVTIPKGLTTYNAGAFDCCTNPTQFTVSSSNSNFAAYNYALYNKTYTTLYQYPAGRNAIYFDEQAHLSLLNINGYAFKGNTKTSSLHVPFGVKYIGGEAFGNMTALQQLFIPSSVTSFVWNAFQNLTALKHFYFNIKTIPSTLTSSNCFYNIASGCKLHIPIWRTAHYSSTSPWSTAFTGGIYEDSYDYMKTYNNSSGGLDYYLGFTVTSTSSYLDTMVQSSSADGQMCIVYGYAGVEGGFNGTMTLPNTITLRGKTYIVTEVQREVFRNQTVIKKVTGGAGIKKIGALSFAGLTGCTQGFNIPNPVEFCDSALFNCWTPTITLGDRLTTIGKDAFRQSAVRQVIMPPSVTSIGSRFVAGVHQLDTLKLSPNITEIPNCGLGWCSARWIVIPYGVKKIGSQAFFSDNYGSGLDEPVRENVVVIPSSVTTIASDAFALARHLDAIFLNVNYGVFTSTKSDWLRRLDPSATNDYDWSGHKLYVPAGQLEQYRNDSGIRQCWSRGDIQCGAFDFTTGNDFWSTMYRMTVVDATNRTAKYVYNWGTGSTSISVANTKTDHNSGITYTMVEIGDSCWVNRPAVTTVSFPSTSNITRIGAYAFKDCTGLTGEISVPATVSSIGQYSFWNCTNLSSLFLNSTGTTTIADYAWNSYDNYAYDRIKLYMPLSQYWNLYGQTKDWLPTGFTYNYLLPYIKPTTEWSAVSVPTEDAVGLPASGDFYIATTYNSTTQAVGKEKLENNMGIKGFEGMLFRGTVGTVYRFRRTDEINSSTPYNVAYYTPSVNYLEGAHPTSYSSNSQTVRDNSTYDYYYFVPADNDFIRISSSKAIYAGEAYLQLTDAQTGGATTVYTSDVATYDLWIAGVQVTDHNRTNLSVIDGVSGTINFDPNGNLLTVKNVTINPTSNAPGIRSSIPGLKINFVGTSNVKSKGANPAVWIESYATMYGTGSANFLSTENIGLRVSNSNTTLTIQGGVQLNAGGQTYGVRGTSSGKIYITGEATKLSALGVTASYSTCVTTLGTGLAITEPAGAAFNSSGTVVSSTGSTIAGTTVVICKPSGTRGDVNGDGSVSIADVTALIDYLLSGSASGINVSAADCNQSGDVSIADVTALIDYLLSGHW